MSKKKKKKLKKKARKELEQFAVIADISQIKEKKMESNYTGSMYVLDSFLKDMQKKEIFNFAEHQDFILNDFMIVNDRTFKENGFDLQLEGDVLTLTRPKEEIGLGRAFIKITLPNGAQATLNFLINTNRSTDKLVYHLICLSD